MNHLGHKNTMNIVKTLKGNHMAKPMAFLKKYGNKNVNI